MGFRYVKGIYNEQKPIEKLKEEEMVEIPALEDKIESIEEEIAPEDIQIQEQEEKIVEEDITPKIKKQVTKKRVSKKEEVATKKEKKK